MQRPYCRKEFETFLSSRRGAGVMTPATRMLVVRKSYVDREKTVSKSPPELAFSLSLILPQPTRSARFDQAWSARRVAPHPNPLPVKTGRGNMARHPALRATFSRREEELPSP
jgi:hypothetical protein